MAIEETKVNNEFMQVVADIREAVKSRENDMAVVKEVAEKAAADLQKAWAKIDELESKANRPAVDVKAAEYEKQSKEFDAFLRRKDYQINGNTAGGYLVPPLMYNEIIRKERDFDPIRQLARVISISGGSPLYVPRITTNQTGGFTTETDSRTESTAAAIEQRPLTPFPLYTQVQATYALLEDAAFDVQGLILEESAKSLAYHEGAAFIGGNGTTAPSGILSDAGVTGNYETAGNDVLTADALVKLPFKVKQCYHNGAVYLMSPSTMAAAVALKDGTSGTIGAYYFHPEPTGPYKWTFNGYPCYLSDSVPDLGNVVYPVIFGNVRMGYTIADVANSLRIIIDPYSQKGVITYHIEKRVAGNVVDPDAFAVIVTS